MPFVQRDDQGRVCGLYANLQADYAEEWLDEDAPEVVDFRGPKVIEQPSRLYKSTLIRRLDEEAGEPEILKALLDAAPLKNRMLWDASEWIGSDDPLFTTLEAAIGGALGADRAAEILAPEA